MLRPRRLRQNQAIRSLLEETVLSVNDFIVPLFVHDQLQSAEISSLPGHQRLDEISLLKKCESLLQKGFKAVALFPAVDEDKKSSDCLEAINESNFICHISKRVKNTFKDDLLVVGDVALDPYSSDGHDGLVKDGLVLNDETVDLLVKMAINQANAGVDILAPSDMMDGRVFAIRHGLDDTGHSDKIIMSYTAKYASSFYGPFRDALNSAPKAGDKKTYQMNPANFKEAMVELDLDLTEGADIVMVKPASMYLDVISSFSASNSMPVAAYHVSGEYAMLKAAAEKGWLDFDQALLETLTSIKRAGASLILSYGAEEALDLLS